MTEVSSAVAKSIEAPMRLLVVADDVLFSERARILARAHGIEGLRTGLWSAGVTVAAQWAPDLVVVDANLSGLDGLSLLAVLKAHPDTAGSRVLFMIDREMGEARARALLLGAAGVLAKRELTADQLVAEITAGRAGRHRAGQEGAVVSRIQSPSPLWR